MAAKTNSLPLSGPRSVRERRSFGDRLVIALAVVCTFIAFSPFVMPY